MAFVNLKQQVTRSTGAVQDAFSRFLQGVDATFERRRLEGELDTLFSELGIEVYQRSRRGDPVEDSVVVRDLIERISQVEDRMPGGPRS